MTDLEAIAGRLYKYIARVNQEESGFISKNEFQELTDNALVDCRHLIEFSRRFSDQINIMAPAMLEIQSLMRD